MYIILIFVQKYFEHINRNIVFITCDFVIEHFTTEVYDEDEGIGTFRYNKIGTGTSEIAFYVRFRADEPKRTGSRNGTSKTFRTGTGGTLIR